MEFWAAVEADQPAYQAVVRVRRLVEPHLNEAFASSSLVRLAVKLRYVPIVMHPTNCSRFPERSEIKFADRVLDCAPVLNYEVFVVGTPHGQLREYMAGIATAGTLMLKFGASQEQMADFDKIIRDAESELMERL